jgi:hypothetical protein
LSTVTSGVCDSFKQELLEGLHCFQATFVSSTHTTLNGATTLVLGGSDVTTNNIFPGMAVSGTNIAANTYVVSVTNSTTLILSIAATGSTSTGTITFTADAFKLALITGTPTNSYDKTFTNYGTGSGSPTTSNLGTDEVASGGGYTTGGFALTNVSPSVPGSDTATISFSVNPSWTSATFSTLGCVIYNTSARSGSANRAVAVYGFGSVQTISSGTFTLTIPVNAAATAILALA